MVEGFIVFFIIYIFVYYIMLLIFEDYKTIKTKKGFLIILIPGGIWVKQFINYWKTLE
jgi:hypothetical protein